MKHFISIASLLLIFLKSSAQDIDTLHQKMIGTWELTKFLSTNNGTGNESPDKIKRIKIVTPSAYSLNLFEAKTGKFTGKIAGAYSMSETKFEGSNYEEKVDSTSLDLKSLRGKVVRKFVSIDEADRMIFVWTDNFITYTEIWIRVIEKK
jgi:hypothetical protein